MQLPHGSHKLLWLPCIAAQRRKNLKPFYKTRRTCFSVTIFSRLSTFMMHNCKTFTELSFCVYFLHRLRTKNRSRIPHCVWLMLDIHVVLFCPWFMRGPHFYSEQSELYHLVTWYVIKWECYVAAQSAVYSSAMRKCRQRPLSVFASSVPKHHLPLVVIHSSVCFARFRWMKTYDL